MVYGVVKQAGGFIHVESAPAQGSTFRIYFPKIERDRGLKEAFVEPAVSSGTGTVLLVEDDALVRGMVKAMLKKMGYTVWVAHNPGEAWTLVENETARIDLLLTDVVMPEMAGTELSKKIGQILPGIKVLFMSGYTSNIILKQGVPFEAIHFIQKPFSIGELGQKVREAMADE